MSAGGRNAGGEVTFSTLTSADHPVPSSFFSPVPLLELDDDGVLRPRLILAADQTVEALRCLRKLILKKDTVIHQATFLEDLSGGAQ